MFFDYTDSGKKEFLSQNQTYFLPGYTGHCPTLKFQFGKCYGACTREIIQTLTSSGIIRQQSKTNLLSGEQFSNSKEYRTSRKYILGYTGYIPGMYRCHGQSFDQIAEKYKKEKSIRKVSFVKKPYTLDSCNIEFVKRHQYPSRVQKLH